MTNSVRSTATANRVTLMRLALKILLLLLTGATAVLVGYELPTAIAWYAGFATIVVVVLFLFALDAIEANAQMRTQLQEYEQARIAELLMARPLFEVRGGRRDEGRAN